MIKYAEATRKLLAAVLSTVLLCLPLTAETIGFVEYHLPEIDQGWKMDRQELHPDANTQMTSIIYVPNKAAKDYPLEFFGATVTNRPESAHTAETLKMLLEQQFATKDVIVTILEQQKGSTLFEWSAKLSAKEIAHGWTRIFSTNQGTVMLAYINQNPDSIASVRPVWLKVLREAKDISHAQNGTPSNPSLMGRHNGQLLGRMCSGRLSFHHQ